MSGDPSGGSDTGGDSDFSGGASGGGFDLGGAISAGSGLFGAASSLLSGNANASADTAAAAGYGKEADLYNQAAGIAGEDIGLEEAGGAVQVAQLQRQANATEATGLTAAAGSNVTGTTVGTILQESQRQASLAVGQQNLQTSINANNFAEIQTGYQAQAQGAVGAQQQEEAAAKASSSGGALGALGQVAGIAAKLAPMLLA